MQWRPLEKSKKYKYLFPLNLKLYSSTGMKKSNRPCGQATLFQTWDKQASKKAKGNGMNFDMNYAGTSSYTVSNNQTRSSATSRDEVNLDDIINIDDDEDDEQLLAAVDQMDSFESRPNDNEGNVICHRDIGNLSFSARPSASDGFMEDEGTPGFDIGTGNCWIYPTNYPVRDYQFNIVQQALFQNTLVTLPTGLGKTFIAAVVMYNFYRWYPQGKIIFMAPTKPLVAQQIDACYNIMGIPRQDTAEMTGNMAPPKREVLWKQKRVFFLTPQVFQNDLSRGSCRADDVVCLVIDEAHKALGNHAYCQVVREVVGFNTKFRVLALSATPGDGIKAVQQVITNLLVSHIELRSEESVDIKPYTHQRQVEKIVIKLGDELEFFKTKFVRVLNVVVNRLAANKVLWSRDVERISKYMLLTAREQFRKNCAAGQQPRNQIGSVEGDFAVGISFFHAYELLLQHGLLPFYNFMKGIVDGTKGSSRAKAELTCNPDFLAIMEDLREQIELPPDECDGNVTTFSKTSPKGTLQRDRPKINPSFVGHPKLTKLKAIVLEHFRACESSADQVQRNAGSRVMIFSQFRDSVQEIASTFSGHKPLVRVMSFIGQQNKGNSSKGLTQKEQLEVIRQFRNGGYNTLVATCVGEEGLDIGEVDLIVCFDASASPIRLVQRMGRTGRKRAGRIVVLVTEGKEEQIYQRSQRNKSSIHKTILEAARTLDLYEENPRMVPKNLDPVCQKMFITVDKKTPKKSKAAKSGKKNSDCDIKTLLSKTAASTKNDGFLSPQELRYWNEKFKLPGYEAGLTPTRSVMLSPRARRSNGQQQPEQSLSLTEWTAWQTSLQAVSFVDHSKRARHFTEIIEFCDFRRDCGEDNDIYDLEMQSFLNSEDIVVPSEERTCEQYQEAGANERPVETGAKERNGEARQSGKKRKNRVVMSDNDDDQGEMCIPEAVEIEGEMRDHRESGCGESSSGRKHAGKKSIESYMKGKRPCKKRKSVDLDFDDDFEDLPSTRLETKVKHCQEQPGMDPASMQNELKSTDHSRDPQSSDNEQDLSDLLDIPCSQRHRHRKTDEATSAGMLPDAPSLATLHELSALNTGECFLENSMQIDSDEETSNEDENPTAFRNGLSCETTKTSRLGKSLLERTTDSWENCPSKGGLFDVGSSDETTDGEEDVRTAVSKKVGETRSVYVKELYQDSQKIVLNEAVVKRSLDDCVSHNSEPSRNGQSRIIRNEDEDVASKTEEGEPEDGSAVFGSGLVCDATSPEKMDDKIEFDFDEDFGNSFFDDNDDDALRDLQTPSLFDDDTFGRKTDRNMAAVKAIVSENPTRHTVDTVKRIVAEDKSGDTKLEGFNGKKTKAEEIDRKVALKRMGAVKAFTGTRNTNDGVHGTYGATSKNLTNEEVENSSEDKNVQALQPGNGGTNKGSAPINHFHRSDGGGDLHRPFANGRKALTTKDSSDRKVVSIAARPPQINDSLQNEVNEQDITNTMKHVKAKQRASAGDSSIKIRSFSFDMSGAADCPTSRPRGSGRGSPLHSLGEEDPDLVAPSPRRGFLNRSIFISSKYDENKFRNVEPKGTSSFSMKRQDVKEPDRAAPIHSPVQRKMFKLKCKRKTSYEGANASHENCNETEVKRHEPSAKNLDSQPKSFDSLLKGLKPHSKSKKPESKSVEPSFKSPNRHFKSPEPHPKNPEPHPKRPEPHPKNPEPHPKSPEPHPKNSASHAKSPDFHSSNRDSSNHRSPKPDFEIFDPRTKKTSLLFESPEASSRGHSRVTWPMPNPPRVDHDQQDGHRGCLDDPEPWRGKESTALEKDSPLLINKAKKKNRQVFRETLFESEEELIDNEDRNEEEEGSGRLEGDESLVSIGKFGKRNSFRNIHNQIKRRWTDSDEEFEEEERLAVHLKRKPFANRELLYSKKHEPQKRRPVTSEFLEQEAEVSDGVESSGHEQEADANDYDIEDSFIDDRSQLTQRSPLTTHRHQNKNDSVDIMDIYRKSLLTPHREQLRLRTPAFHRSKNRYKMVFNAGTHGQRSSSSSQTDVDERSTDLSERGDDSCESDVGDVSHVEPAVGEGVSVSPDESQVVIRKKRPGKKRILRESYFESPEAATQPEKKVETDFRKNERDPGTISSGSRGTSRLHVEMPRVGRASDDHRATISGNFRQPSFGTKDGVFKRPLGQMSTRVDSVVTEGKTEAGAGWKGNNKEMDEILADLEDSDESFLMEIDELPSFSTGFDGRASNAGRFSNAATKTKSLPPERCDQRQQDGADRQESTNQRSKSGNATSSCAKRNLSTSNGSKHLSEPMDLRQTGRTEVFLPNKRSALHNSPEMLPNRGNVAQDLNVKPVSIVESLSTASGIRTALAYSKPRVFNSHHQNTVGSSGSHKSEVGDKTTKRTSPLYPPLLPSKTNSSSFSATETTTCYTNVSPQTASESSMSFERMRTVGTPDVKRDAEKASPTLTATQRDKNKLTILVSSREVSNCQIVSFLRRKHNMKAIVSQITGCDYILSNRMGVERRLFSDISNPTNSKKLTERVRELCDLYDRPCLVIEKDRLKQGETENKLEVRTKYFDRVLACFAQAHVKVLFSDSQEGTSNILASLAQVEAKKNAAIIYPLPLSKEKEQVVKFLSSIPRTSYITAVSLCYHNRTLQNIANSSAEDLAKKTNNLSLKRASDIVKFLQHAFCVSMVTSGNT